jgi:hypothetical protein
MSKENENKAPHQHHRKKFCTLENFVSEGMGIIGEKHSSIHLVLKLDDTKQNVDFLNRNKLRKWKAAYGVRPLVAYDAWLRISKKARMRGIMTHHLFWCLHWMKTYGTEDNVSRALGTTPKTLRKKVKTVLKLLSKCIHSVVRLIDPIICADLSAGIVASQIF